MVLPEKPEPSRSQQAADWYKEDTKHRTIAMAAKKFGISWQTVQHAVKMNARRCDCCGQVIRSIKK